MIRTAVKENSSKARTGVEGLDEILAGACGAAGST